MPGLLHTLHGLLPGMVLGAGVVMGLVVLVRAWAWQRRRQPTASALPAPANTSQTDARQACTQHGDGAGQAATLERLNLAVAIGGIGVWDWDIQADHLDLDAVSSRAFGTDRLRIQTGVREFLIAAVHPYDRAEFEDTLLDALEDFDTFTYRCRVLLSDRSVQHLQLSSRILRDAHGTVLRLVGITTDVSAEMRRTELLQQQAEDERALRDRLNLATQTAGIGVWDLDLLTHRLAADDTVYDILGFDGQLDQQTLLGLIHPEDRGDVAAKLRSAIIDQEYNDILSLAHRVTQPRGTIRHIQTHVRIFRDSALRATRLVGVTWDVSEAVEHAAQLREQAERVQTLLNRFNVVIETAGISAWEMDVRTEKMVWIENRQKTFGLADLSVEAYGDALFAMIHPDDRVEVSETLRIVTSGQRQSHSYRYRLLRPDGLVRHMQSHVHAVRDELGSVARLLGATTDITNEVHTNELLQRQATHERALLERLNIATQAAGITSWEIDLQTSKFLWIENAPPEIIAPHEKHNLSLAVYDQRVHPDDLAALREQMRLVARGEVHTVPQRYRIHTGDGRLVHIQTNAKLIQDEQGCNARLLGVSWDVTDEVIASERLQQQAERLQDAERRLERASLSSSEGHWEVNLLTRTTWASSSYHALLGYAAGELPAAHDEFRLLEHPDDLARSEALLARHIDTGEPYDMETRIRTASGEYRWFRRRGTAERDADGRLVSVAGSIHDVHQRKLAEDELRLVQQRFARAIKGTQDGLWELEGDGTAWCSPRIGELLGYAGNELPCNTNFLRSFLHPEDADAVATATRAHFQKEQPYDMEVRLRTKSGEYRWYRARASAERNSEGRSLRLSGSLQDVTEARQAHQELLQAIEAAEAANRAKSEFLANVSHEIRTPMNGIIGMTGLLLDTTLDRTQRDYADTIRGSADSLLTVINDILDFSKIEAGKLDIEAIELDLRGNVEEVGSMMAVQAAARGLELVVHMHPTVPSRVIGDPQRVRQCLINLVGNAIKFTPRGEIVIEVSVQGLRDGRALTRFEVRDTGIGIAPDVLTTLFQPFVQADSSTTRHFGGTGLGLSIVRRLVDMMGGQLGVTSEVGKGSTFWFMLPLEPVEKNLQSGAFDLTRLGRRILVADDNETNRRVLAGQLVHAGYEVSLAGSGSDALRLMQQALDDGHPFEAVLADYQLSDMDGAALGERINADPLLAHARVIMLTSLDRQGDMSRCASLGFAGYLTKPVRARELLACLDRVLAHDAKEWHLRSQSIITRGMLASGSHSHRYQGRVLLVEDNAVNQKVAVRFLERMGCEVHVTDNGAAGVKAWRQAPYDLILMDLQMPEMDGIAATRRIRELELGSGLHIPIVALTANAMTGQLERCLEAGMDGFLTKPLEIARLHETLERYGLSVTLDQHESGLRERNDVPPIDLARLNELADCDHDFIHELTLTFIASGEQILQEAAAALAGFDRLALERASHKLKGASANIHAEPLRARAHELERQAHNLDRSRLQELFDSLRSEFERTVTFLRQNTSAAVQKTG